MLESLRERIPNSGSNILVKDTEISPSTIVVRSEDNLSCDLQGEAVVLDLQSGTYFGLNPLAARIWELIQTATLVSEVHRQLLEEYRIESRQCEEDLLTFLKQLELHDLIRVVEPTTC